jgi:N-dimethylarginine dimethylaminohydrolase
MFVQSRSGDTVVFPAEEAIAAGKQGDLAVPHALSGLVSMTSVPSRMHFEGGNVVDGKAELFVGPAVDRRSPDGAVAQFGAWLRRPIVVVGGGVEPPHGHLDMYLAIVDGDTAIVGDPLLLADRLDRASVQRALAGMGTFCAATQQAHAERYETVAKHLADLGYRVVRVPALHDDEDETLLTWTNAVVERRDGALRAYVPVYGIPYFDRAALRIWRRLDVETFPIRCRRLIKEGGAVRCITNVLRES